MDFRALGGKDQLLPKRLYSEAWKPFALSKEGFVNDAWPSLTDILAMTIADYREAGAVPQCEAHPYR